MPKSPLSIDVRIKNDLNDPIAFRTLSWLRFVTFEGDINDLYKAKEFVIQMGIADYKLKGKSEEQFRKDHKFTGAEMAWVNLATEVGALTRFKQILSDNLK